MKEMIKIVRKIDVTKEYESELVAESDYWLASLSHAMGTIMRRINKRHLPSSTALHESLKFTGIDII